MQMNGGCFLVMRRLVTLNLRLGGRGFDAFGVGALAAARTTIGAHRCVFVV